MLPAQCGGEKMFLISLSASFSFVFLNSLPPLHPLLYFILFSFPHPHSQHPGQSSTAAASQRIPKLLCVPARQRMWMQSWPPWPPFCKSKFRTLYMYLFCVCVRVYVCVFGSFCLILTLPVSNTTLQSLFDEYKHLWGQASHREDCNYRPRHDTALVSAKLCWGRGHAWFEVQNGTAIKKKEWNVNKRIKPQQ